MAGIGIEGGARDRPGQLAHAGPGLHLADEQRGVESLDAALPLAHAAGARGVAAQPVAMDRQARLAPAEMAGIGVDFKGHVAHAVVGRLAVGVDAAFVVAGQDDHMVGVDRAHGLVELADHGRHVVRVGAPWFVEQAVAGHRRSVAVARGDLLPQPGGAGLEGRRAPVQIALGAAAVVFRALAAGGAMQVEHHIDAAALGLGDGLVEVAPGVGAQLARLALVFEHGVDEGQAHQVETVAGQHIPIAFGDPIVAKQGHQALALGVAESPVEGRLQLALVVDAGRALPHHPKFID